MIRHIIKLIWTRKRKNILLLIEITISFLVLFAIASMVIHNYKKFRLAQGFDYHNVWVLRFQWKDEGLSSVRGKMIQVKQHLKSKDEIEYVSVTTGNHPYSFSTTTSSINDMNAHFVSCEDEFFDILSIPVIKGEKFSEMDRARAKTPIIINKKLAEELFPGEDPIGKVTDSDQEVIGLIDKYRYSHSFTADIPVYFSRRYLEDTTNRYVYNNIIFSVKSGTNRAFEARLMREINAITVGWENDLLWLEEEKDRRDRAVWIPIMILVLISAFLIVNVALGLFGLLWYNITRRKAEIGLRRAMGANISNISRHFVSEIIVLTSFAVILGLFFAIQFPILGVFNLDPDIYILAMIVSALIIFGINWLSAAIPSRQASKIQPATALHDEG